MKLNATTKRILKIASISALALLEAYLVYATVASMNTYHQHPRFVSADGQVAQSSGYRTQSFLCLAFAIVMPILAGVLSYFYWFRRKKASPVDVKAALGVEEPMPELAATADVSADADTVGYGADEPSPLPQ